MPNDDVRINPQITETDIGIRNLRKIKIYPLALGDEIKLTETLSKAIADYFEKMNAVEGMSDIAVAGFVVDLIKQNFEQIIGFVVGSEVDVPALIQDITNYQAAGIARIIYEKNFEEASKNAGGLFEMVKKLFLSERPLPPFVSGTLTDIPLSTEPVSETEELQEES